MYSLVIITCVLVVIILLIAFTGRGRTRAMAALLVELRFGPGTCRELQARATARGDRAIDDRFMFAAAHELVALDLVTRTLAPYSSGPAAAYPRFTYALKNLP